MRKNVTEESMQIFELVLLHSSKDQTPGFLLKNEAKEKSNIFLVANF
jgi:hypothetical protein